MYLSSGHVSREQSSPETTPGVNWLLTAATELLYDTIRYASLTFIHLYSFISRPTAVDKT